MGDNSHDRDNSENQDIFDSSEEEVIIEEYETFYVPQHLLTEDQNYSEKCDVKPSATHLEQSERNKYGCDLRKEKEISKIKTITRIDEETENVVILIRPRRRSVSPTEDKAENFGNVSESYDWTDRDVPESQTLKRDLCTTSSGERKFNVQDDNTISSQTLENYKNEKNSQRETYCDRNINANIGPTSNFSNGNSETPENSTFSTLEENSSQVSVLSDLNGNDIITSTEENLPDVELTSKYEIQGARPKTIANLTALKEDTIVVGENEVQCTVMSKSSSKPGISKETNEKVKKLKENGHYDILVKNCNVPGKKGVVNEMVNKLNIDNSNQEIDEDDVLIWQLMKSLKERSNKSESRHDINQDINPSDSSPEDKCDWSYEKATLSKDKYLSRRLQTKEIGQVKVITFMSPAKEKGHVKITPLKVSRTLPFNVKNIFQQKMEELKNKRRVCLTGGKELMFTTVNIDDPR